ncbi:hypothetical protein ACSBR1_029386 [Camellia fascicularis]
MVCVLCAGCVLEREERAGFGVCCVCVTTTATVPGGAPPPPPSHSTTNYLTSLSLGYAIAIALSFLVLVSTLLLVSYVCLRHRRRRQNLNPSSTTTTTTTTTSSDNGIILPRIIFVAEDDNKDNNNAVVGLDQAVINSYPRFPFSKDRGGEINNSMCSICLCEYRDAEMLRLLLGVCVNGVLCAWCLVSARERRYVCGWVSI